MSPEVISIVLSIVGILITIALTINAFFIRDLVEKLTQVRIIVATIASELTGTTKRVDSAENNQRDIFYRIYKLEGKDKSK